MLSVSSLPSFNKIRYWLSFSEGIADGVYAPTLDHVNSEGSYSVFEASRLFVFTEMDLVTSEGAKLTLTRARTRQISCISVAEDSSGNDGIADSDQARGDGSSINLARARQRFECPPAGMHAKNLNYIALESHELARYTNSELEPISAVWSWNERQLS